MEPLEDWSVLWDTVAPMYSHNTPINCNKAQRFAHDSFKDTPVGSISERLLLLLSVKFLNMKPEAPLTPLLWTRLVIFDIIRQVCVVFVTRASKLGNDDHANLYKKKGFRSNSFRQWSYSNDERTGDLYAFVNHVCDLQQVLRCPELLHQGWKSD